MIPVWISIVSFIFNLVFLVLILIQKRRNKEMKLDSNKAVRTALNSIEMELRKVKERHKE